MKGAEGVTSVSGKPEKSPKKDKEKTQNSGKTASALKAPPNGPQKEGQQPMTVSAFDIPVAKEESSSKKKSSRKPTDSQT